MITLIHPHCHHHHALTPQFSPPSPHIHNHPAATHTVNVTSLEPRPQRWVEGVAWKGRHGNTKRNHTKPFVHSHKPQRVGEMSSVVCLEKTIKTIGRDEKATVLKLHLSILKQVVEHWQNVALDFLKAFEHKHASVDRRIDNRLIHVADRTASTDFPPLRTCMHPVGARDE
jgi:hypothetical protein